MRSGAAGFTTGWEGEWIPLAAVRVTWTIIAFCLTMFAWHQYRLAVVNADREPQYPPRVPPPVSLFLLGWSAILFAAGVWLILLDPIANQPQSVWFRAGLGAAFSGSLGGALWVLTYLKRAPYCTFHDRVVNEMARQVDKLQTEP